MQLRQELFSASDLNPQAIISANVIVDPYNALESAASECTRSAEPPLRATSVPLWQSTFTGSPRTVNRGSRRIRSQIADGHGELVPR